MWLPPPFCQCVHLHRSCIHVHVCLIRGTQLPLFAVYLLFSSFLYMHVCSCGCGNAYDFSKSNYCQRVESSFSSPREIDMLYYVFVRMSRAERLSSSYINLCIFHNLLCFRATCIMWLRACSLLKHFLVMNASSLYYNALHEYCNTNYAHWCTHITLRPHETSIYRLMYPWLSSWNFHLLLPSIHFIHK